MLCLLWLRCHSPRPGENELTFFLRMWTREHENFKGAFKIKMSMLALMQIFQSNNALLNNVSVPGDLVVQPGRSTRSKNALKPHYSEEPLKHRIFKLIVREHVVRGVLSLLWSSECVQVIIENEEDSFSMSDSDQDDDFGDDDSEDEMARRMLKSNAPAHLVSQLANPYSAQAAGKYLDELLDDEDDDESPEDAEDPDIKADPIYTLDLKKHIENFLKALAASHREAFTQMANMLAESDKKHLQDNVFA